MGSVKIKTPFALLSTVLHLFFLALSPWADLVVSEGTERCNAVSGCRGGPVGVPHLCFQHVWPAVRHALAPLRQARVRLQCGLDVDVVCVWCVDAVRHLPPQPSLNNHRFSGHLCALARFAGAARHALNAIDPTEQRVTGWSGCSPPPPVCGGVVGSPVQVEDCSLLLSLPRVRLWLYTFPSASPPPHPPTHHPTHAPCTSGEQGRDSNVARCV